MGKGPQPFRIVQSKESGYSVFSFINSKLSVFEGWGSREVMWDMWDHWGLQEDWKESCKGFRTAWSERKPEVHNWQLNKPAQIGLFPTGENPWLLLSAPHYTPSQNDHLERKKNFCFFCNSHKTTGQYLVFFWSYMKTANPNMPDGPLLARNWDINRVIWILNHSIHQRLSGAQTMNDAKICFWTEPCILHSDYPQGYSSLIHKRILIHFK